MRKRRLFTLLAVAAAAAAAVAFMPDGSRAPEIVTAAPPAATAQTSFAALPEREPIGRLRGEIFSTPAPERQAPAAAAKPKPAQEASPAPATPPPMPYRVAGRLVNGDGAHVVLAKGDAVLTVQEGDSLAGGYRVEAVAPEAVTLVYVPLGARQVLPIASTLAFDAAPARAMLASPPSSSSAGVLAGRPAQLRWEGPREVRAGDAFEVVLKVTSEHAVRASPLQLSFDAKLLEPLAVRPGGFYTDGMFSFRINPAGSIFVGAAGKGAVASDAEFVVVTFKPMRAGETAELKVSSLVLQGASGAIAHDRPAAFRTVISR